MKRSKTQDDWHAKVVTPRLMWCCYEVNGTVHFFEEKYLTLGCGVLHRPHVCSIVANGIPVACVPLDDLEGVQLRAYQAWWKAREQGLPAKQQMNAALAAIGIKKPRAKRRANTKLTGDGAQPRRSV